MSELPGDLVEEILCRVPATSLQRLRCTCKRWNRLFNKRRFIRKHSDKATKQLLVLMSKRDMICLMSVNLYGISSLEVKAQYTLVDPEASLYELDLELVSHCDGLLLCTNRDYNRIEVWNPCTGQTKWIVPRKIGSYALGSYQDNKYGDKSYKILCCCDGDNNGFEIYEINSSFWRTLDVTLDCKLEYSHLGTNLKGQTYWFATDEKEKQLGMFLASFDYTRERFERLLLPCHCIHLETLALSTVREEKLSVLLKDFYTSETEVWVTNEIDETTKVVSWSKVLTVDLKPELGIFGAISFLVDEEKKFLMCCHMEIRSGVPIKQIAYIFGEDNIAKEVLSEYASSWPVLLNYVPSLTQIKLCNCKYSKEECSEVPVRTLFQVSA